MDTMEDLREAKKAMTDQDWIDEAERYTEEVLDWEMLEVLKNSGKKEEVYRAVAMFGKQTYMNMLEWIENTKPTGMDEFIAMDTAVDYKLETMHATLMEKMEMIYPGFKEMYM